MDVAPWCYKRVDGMGLDMGIFGWGGVYIEQIWSIDYRWTIDYRSRLVMIMIYSRFALVQIFGADGRTDGTQESKVL